MRLRVILTRGAGCFGFELSQALSNIDTTILGTVVDSALRFNARELPRDNRFVRFDFSVHGFGR